MPQSAAAASRSVALLDALASQTLCLPGGGALKSQCCMRAGTLSGPHSAAARGLQGCRVASLSLRIRTIRAVHPSPQPAH
jgi:hypothetical protein